ncbi:MAG: DUF6291 domain-containing protein [Prevotella sp.]|nr:DUF6291 domain-containing protein [Prevotella sp.]
MNNEETFVFNTRWVRILDRITPDIKHEVIDATIAYWDTGVVPDLKPLANLAFLFIKDDLDRQRAARAGKVAPTEKEGNKISCAELNIANGEGDSPVKTGENHPECSENQGAPVELSFLEKGKGKENEKEKENSPHTPYKEKDKEKENQREKERVLNNACAREKIFTPPAIEDVAAYVKEKGYTFDPALFMAHYESNNWMVGRAKMKSWKAACVTWQKMQPQYASPGAQANTPATDTDAPGVARPDGQGGYYYITAQGNRAKVLLGYEERIVNGRRTYGDGSRTVPLSAHPRPNEMWNWSNTENDWAPF